MKKTLIWIIGGVLIVVLLAGGAFMAMRLLGAKTLIGGGPGGPSLSMVTKGGGAGSSVFFKQVPAPELPKQAPDLRGMVTSIQNNSIFVSQADKIQVSVINGVQQNLSTPTGPATEVVVSKDTKIWRDTTMDNMPKPGASSSGGPMQIQQKVEAADISAITSNSFVQVWGQRRGDRITADVVVVMGIGVAKTVKTN